MSREGAKGQQWKRVFDPLAWQVPGATQRDNSEETIFRALILFRRPARLRARIVDPFNPSERAQARLAYGDPLGIYAF
jgi:hypothetical protein